MTFTGFSGGSSGPVPATAGVVARPGAATAPPGAGRAFAAVMGAGGADGSDAPDASVPDMATGGDGPFAAAGAAAPGPATSGMRRVTAAVPGNSQGADGADDAETAIVAAPGDSDAMPSFGVMPQVDAAQRVGTVPLHDAMSADATARHIATPTPASHHAQAPPSTTTATQAPARLPEQGGEGAESGERPQDSGSAARPGQGGAPDVRSVSTASPRATAVPDGRAAPMEAGGTAPGAPETPDTPDAPVTSARPRPPLAADAPDASRPALVATPNRGSAAQAAVAVTAQARATPPQSPARIPGSGEEGVGSTTRATKAGSAILPGRGGAQEARQIAVSAPRVPAVSDGRGQSQHAGGDGPDFPAQPRKSLAAPPAPAGRASPAPAASVPQAAVALQPGAATLHPEAPPIPSLAPAPAPIIPAEGKRSAPPVASSAPKGRFDAPRASGPRAAPALPVVAVAPPPLGAPVQADASTAFAAAMRIAADLAGHADPTLAASDQDVSAPQAPSLSPPAPQGAAAQDIPRQIALRIAHAAAGAVGAGRGTIELSLSPEELGRVRLRLHPSEGGLSVTITADRPETLDLMRRNIDLLAREFLEIGYEGAQFDFAQGGPSADADPGAPDLAPAPTLAAPPPDTARPSQAALLMLGDRLDIRL